MLARPYPIWIPPAFNYSFPSASKKWQPEFLVNIRSTENFSLMIPRFDQLHQIVPAEGEGEEKQKTKLKPHK